MCPNLEHTMESPSRELDVTCRLEMPDKQGNPAEKGPRPAGLGTTTVLGDMLDFLQHRVLKHSHHGEPASLSQENATDTRPVEELPEGEEESLSTLSLGQLDAQYAILKRFAEGGQGILSQAQDKVLRRIVALKSLRPEHLDNPAVRHAFLNEALITAQLEHPAVVSVYGLLKDKGPGIHLAMKLVKGRTLKEILEADAAELAHHRLSRWDYRDRLHYHVEIFLRVCDAVGYAHSRGIIHCDLKPENLMLGEYGEAYVMDWGIAKCLASEARRPGKPLLDGTPRFIPPEAYAGKLRDPRADIYALGLILYEIATLRHAFEARNVRELAGEILAGRRLPVVNPYGVPIHPALVAIIDKATAYDPEDRYTTVAEFCRDIRRYLGDEPVAARPDTLWMSVRRFLAHHIQLVVGLIAAGWITALLLMVVSMAQMRDRAIQERNLEMERSRMLQENNNILNYRQRLLSMEAKVMQSAIALSQQMVSLNGRLRRTADLASFLYSTPPVVSASTLPMVEYREYQKGEGPAFGTVSSPVYYGKRLNPDILSYVAAPGVEPASVQPMLERMRPLGTYLRRLVLTSSGVDRLSPEAIPALEEEMLQKGLLFRRAFLGLEETGLQIAYPFNPEYAEDFDNRKRPWYVATRKAWEETRSTEVIWGRPYRDSGEQGRMLLACSTPVLDAHGNFVGVMGADVHFERLVGLLARNGNGVEDGITEKYLLNRAEEGLCRLDTRKAGEGVEDFLSQAEGLPAEVLEAIRQSHDGSGVREWTNAQGEKELFFYAYLPNSDACIVERGTQEALLHQISREHAGPHAPGCLQESASPAP